MTKYVLFMIFKSLSFEMIFDWKNVCAGIRSQGKKENIFVPYDLWSLVINQQALRSEIEFRMKRWMYVHVENKSKCSDLCLKTALEQKIWVKLT